MDFSVSEKIQTIVQMINEFVDKELIPLEPEFLVKDFKTMLPVLREKQAMVKKMELWAPNFPVECGGMGLSLLEHGLVSEALGRSPLGHYVFWCQAPDAGNVEILHLYGTDGQKERYLTPLVQGNIRSCFSMTEVDLPGSNPVAPAIRRHHRIQGGGQSAGAGCGGAGHDRRAPEKALQTGCRSLPATRPGVAGGGAPLPRGRPD